MRYQITVWILDHNDVPDYRYECYCETQLQGECAFNALLRGVAGHYKAWFIDLTENREIRYSSVTYKGNGER